MNKWVLYIALLLFSVQAISQTKIDSLKLKGAGIAVSKIYSENDTIPKVFYPNQINAHDGTALFVNNELLPFSVLQTIDNRLIEDMKIEKQKFNVDSVQYSAAIQVFLKNDYKPSYISINQLLEKYTKLKDEAIILQLDGKIIDENYDRFLVDEKFILKIEISPIKQSLEDIELYLVKMVTRTEKNLEKANTIILRGS